MSGGEDYWTSTVDGAAGHARQYADDAYDDRPDPSDFAGEETIGHALVRRAAEELRLSARRRTVEADRHAVTTTGAAMSEQSTEQQPEQTVTTEVETENATVTVDDTAAADDSSTGTADDAPSGDDAATDDDAGQGGSAE